MYCVCLLHEDAGSRARSATNGALHAERMLQQMHAPVAIAAKPQVLCMYDMLYIICLHLHNSPSTTCAERLHATYMHSISLSALRLLLQLTTVMLVAHSTFALLRFCNRVTGMHVVIYPSLAWSIVCGTYKANGIRALPSRPAMTVAYRAARQ